MASYIEDGFGNYTLCVRGSRYLIYEPPIGVKKLNDFLNHIGSFDDEVYEMFRATVKFNSGDANFGVVSEATGVFNISEPITRREASAFLFRCDNIRRVKNLNSGHLVTTIILRIDLPIREVKKRSIIKQSHEEYDADKDSNLRKHVERMTKDVEVAVAITSFSKATYEEAEEIKSYVKTQYANHFYDAISVLYSVNNLGERVVAPGDGVGVIKGACDILGVNCYSSDKSKAMVSYAKFKGMEVFHSGWKDAVCQPGTIVLQNLLRVIPDIAARIAVNYPERRVLIIDDEEFFKGREFYESARVMENGVYLRNLSVNSHRYKLSYPIKSRGIVWSKFFMPNLTYMIDDPFAARLMHQHQYWGSSPIVCATNMKFVVGFQNVVSHTFNSIYLFWNVVQPGYKQYFSMKHGRYINLDLDVDFDYSPSIRVKIGYMFMYDGVVKGKCVQQVRDKNNSNYYYVVSSGVVKLFSRSKILQMEIDVIDNLHKTV